MKVFVAGEGPTELGDYARHPSYRAEPPNAGVVETILRKVRPEGWEVADGIQWRRIRKYRVLSGGDPEVRNVLGAALAAKESGCEVLAFVRDRDRDEEREGSIRSGIDQAPTVIDGCPSLVGGVAIEAIESWILSLGGERGAEKHRRPKERLGAIGVAEMVEKVKVADLAAAPSDAQSLLDWLQMARSVFVRQSG